MTDVPTQSDFEALERKVERLEELLTQQVDWMVHSMRSDGAWAECLVEELLSATRTRHAHIDVVKAQPALFEVRVLLPPGCDQYVKNAIKNAFTDSFVLRLRPGAIVSIAFAEASVSDIEAAKMSAKQG